ncbi:tryptophan synthase beta subunit-like PLP-dependent enzyme [Blyttiomyces helicus]|uniref:Tryptophan synthase n=1 Tax=Blyttiomyces helicus TaxID=388810 RepID=A0A4P9W499_9FUNG|nr:tryptophan synthase beta subunit-like PLP-dependent enzyme [Blyttiomyces helicus]|eukprot:RKO87171.1 tryptophan synthase beta subunit-like PLP-dependent enzyme [Blyttiomyces helicus]
MSMLLRSQFDAAKKDGRPAFVTYVTAGYPTADDTVDTMLALQSGGADVIELGVPFSDPMADGPTIQEANVKALENGVDIAVSIGFVARARELGLTIPVVLMGYYNPFLIYGDRKLMRDCEAAGVCGFIIADLPPEESVRFRKLGAEFGLSYVPIIAPNTTDARIKALAQVADSFIYVVSTLGVTGARAAVSSGLPALVARIKEHTSIPLAVGFGVSTRDHFVDVGARAEGVVIGSKIITIMRDAGPGKGAKAVGEFASWITGRAGVKGVAQPAKVVEPVVRKSPFAPHFGGGKFFGLGSMAVGAFSSWLTGRSEVKEVESDDESDEEEEVKEVVNHIHGGFGEFGGQFAPEALMDVLEAIEHAFNEAKSDPVFWEEFRSHYSYMGRPSPLHLAKRLTEDAGGARIWLKREDLNHTGSHKINNAMGQVLFAMRLGKKRIIAETGTGLHGVATATVCAKFGLECVIYMGAEDVRRHALNVFRIRLLGATVISVESGSKTLKDAVNEAMRDCVTNVATTYYILGSPIGPHPFPTIVREFQSVIGRETRASMLDQVNKLPNAVVACVGGGSSAIGMFHPFANDPTVRLIGVESAGDGLETGRHSATLAMGTPGVYHGTRTYLIQDKHGNLGETHSLGGCLDYPGVGPEHAWLKETGRAEYVSATDMQAIIGFRKISQLEGIIPALETAHAVYKVMELAKSMSPEDNIVLCLNGRGDTDVEIVADALPKYGPQIDWNLRFDKPKPQ